MMICPNCGTWIDAGEPCCPGCLWNPYEEDEKEDEYELYNKINLEDHIIHNVNDGLNDNFKKCPSCGRIFKDSDYKICPSCGGEL